MLRWRVCLQAYILYTFVGLSRTSLIQLLLTNDTHSPAEVPSPRSDPRIVGYRPLALHHPPNNLLCVCLTSSLALCLLLLCSEPRSLPHRSTNHGATWLADRDCPGWYHRCELCGDGAHRSTLPLLVTIASYGTRFVVCDIRAWSFTGGTPFALSLNALRLPHAAKSSKTTSSACHFGDRATVSASEAKSPFFPSFISPSHRSFVVRGWLCAPDIRAIDVNLYLM